MVGMMSQEELEERRREELGSLSPEGEMILDWLLGDQRSVQEVDERLALLDDTDREYVEGALATSPSYGSAFVRHLAALNLRDMNRGNNVQAGASRYRREAPAGYQRVLKEIGRLRDVGRNVMALTPELLPEDLMRIWPSGKPLPELVIVNFDHPIPQVSMVRRLPSAGGLPLSRADLVSMTGLVRLVMGRPGPLRQIAAAQGIALDHSFEQVNVGMTEIAWSPHLELGELLYDSESVRDDDKEDQHRDHVGELEARAKAHGDVLPDLASRVQDLRDGWARDTTQEGRLAEERLRALHKRIDGLAYRSDALKGALQDLARHLTDGDQGEMDQRLVEAQQALEALEAESQEAAASVAEEERVLDTHRASAAPDTGPRPDRDLPAGEEDEETERRKAKAKASEKDRPKDTASDGKGREG